MLLHKVMEFGNGNFLIAVRKKERVREQAENALYFFLFFLIKQLSSAVCILSPLLHLLDWIILHFDWNDVRAR